MKPGVNVCFLPLPPTPSPISGVPKITMVPEDTRVTEEDKVSLFCRASGEPAPTITWEINGEKINNNADFEISEGPYISSLRIKKARYGDHNKKFTCEAHNKLGNTRAAADVFIYRKKDGPEGRLASRSIAATNGHIYS